MQLHIAIKLDKPITLPVNYNNIMQGVIYKALSAEDPDYARTLHDTGSAYGMRRFKPFTFGPLEGRARVKDKRITFFESLTWEVRSSDVRLISILMQQFKSKGITLLSNHLRCASVSVTDTTIGERKIQIKALSPIVAYSTLEDGYTYYYTPEERGFYEVTKLNALKRYAAIMRDDAADIEFKPISVRQSDKVVTKYRGIVMSGWRGYYELEGTPELLDLLYQTGLGAKNAQGFGMFDIVDKSKKT